MSRGQQIAEYISNEDVRGRMGVPVPLVLVVDFIGWVIYSVGRMCDSCLPKQMPFGWLPQRCPFHGVKLRWRDRVRKDLKHFGIIESDWYVEAQDRYKWSQLCVSSPSLSEPVQPWFFLVQL